MLNLLPANAAVVRTVVALEFAPLRGLSAAALRDRGHAADVAGLLHGVPGGLFARLRTEAADEDADVSLSDILVSKIALGTLGCTVAYDRFAQTGLWCHGMIQKLGRNSYLQLAEFWHQHEAQFRDARKIAAFADYPPMKLLDMYFWSVGRKWWEERRA